MFRILHGRWGCNFKIPVMTENRVILREELCMLPKGHNGPHKVPSGGVVINMEGHRREWEQRFAKK